ncbi:hypothetical protein [Nitrincola sp.]|uniref:hypothetical protein n=1 Tax=Nitrincola sp. TaxID=1926584 RepID=UPI003A8E2588
MHHPQYIIFNGQRYDLRHLFRMKHTFTLRCGTEVPTGIVFSNHCYTEPHADGEPEEGHTVLHDHYGNKRIFCPIRHSYTLDARQWIAGWTSQVCYLSKDRKHSGENWLIVEDKDGMPIKVAFSAQQSNQEENGLFIRVKTIHPYDKSKPPPSDAPNMPFTALAHSLAVKGVKPKPPKSRNKRRR